MSGWNGDGHMGLMSLGWILRRRYARGEIDRETYQRMMKDLEG
jgi:uncharacterized membrane protein